MLNLSRQCKYNDLVGKNSKSGIHFEFDVHKFERKIQLPQLDTYPLRIFSNIRENFAAAAIMYPDLAKQFNLLNSLKNKIDTLSIVRISSVCLVKVLKRKKMTAYIQIVFECKESDFPIVEELLTKFGL